ncbi:MAG: hypothetical protein QOE11_1738 [Solirubrobacteraceae bacterium]|jgi:hypothetical protein|nr:hypothetical protein [Solirubrobacteraceae bacterium]
MNSRTKVLKELVREEHYVIDPIAVAEAILVRSAARRLLPDVSFRSTEHTREVRSFRPHRGARSFRLTRAERRPPHRASDDAEPSHLR